MKIVDDEHHRQLVCEVAEQLSHRGEELRAALLGIDRDEPQRLPGAVPARRRIPPRGGGLGEGAHPAQDREGLREERGVPGHHLGEVHRRCPREHPAQRVDDPVERFVGDALALVTAGGQHDGAGLLGHELREAAHDGRFADPRFSQHGDRARLAAQRLVEGVAQDSQLQIAPDEGPRPPSRLLRRGGDDRIAARSALLVPRQLLQDLVARRPQLRGDPEEIHAQLVQIGRDPHRELDRGERLVALLGDERVPRRLSKWELPGERAVEDDAEAVYVGLGPDLQGRRLLRGHVFLGTHDHVGLGLFTRAPHLHDEPEVEEHHAPLQRDHDVGGLDVAVNLPRRVERSHAAHELRERRA